MAETTTIDEQTTAPPILRDTVRSRRGEPTWELARTYPLQGEWTEEQYLLSGFEIDVTALFTAAGEITATEPPNDTSDK